MTSPAPSATGSEIARIAEQLRRMYEGPAWHGPALKEVLDGVTEQQAAARPLENAHTIWELVLHLTTWMRVARERLSATQNVDPSAEENWPQPTGNWQDALAAMREEYRRFERATREFREDRLEERAPATEPQSFYSLLHGAIQHIAYHAGQIALLKKAF